MKGQRARHFIKGNISWKLPTCNFGTKTERQQNERCLEATTINEDVPLIRDSDTNSPPFLHS